jgi:hypothetical protein
VILFVSTFGVVVVEVRKTPFSARAPVTDERKPQVLLTYRFLLPGVKMPVVGFDFEMGADLRGMIIGLLSNKREIASSVRSPFNIVWIPDAHRM